MNMRTYKKKLSLLITTLLLTGAILTGGTAVASPVNLINGDTIIQQETTAVFENGLFSMSSKQGEYLASFTVPDLTNTYTWSGDVTVTDIDDTVPYSGVRFCIGYDAASSNYINLIITRNIGVSADQRGAIPISEVYPLSKVTYSDALSNGKKFHFEIIRDAAHVIMKIDTKVVMDFTLGQDFNLFTDGDDLNLGFYSCMCAFDVENLAVYDEHVVVATVPTAKSQVTSTSLASNALVTSPSISKAKATSNPNSSLPKATSNNNDKKDGSISPTIIVAMVVAALLIAVTVVVVIKKRNANK